jgi:hypothetical protein
VLFYCATQPFLLPKNFHRRLPNEGWRFGPTRKTIGFVLFVQARRQASAQKHNEQIPKHDQQIAELKSSTATISDLVGRLAEAEIRQVERVGAAT